MKKQDSVLTEYAKALRKNATKEENTLWYQHLRNYHVNWYRQKIIGPYIADFYCKSLKLVIEIDGGQHYENSAMEYDRKRTEYFQSLGLEVIRFTNTDINKRLGNVCDYIDEKVAAKQGLR